MRIRIDTPVVTEVGRRLMSDAESIAGIGRRLAGAVGGLGWESRSRIGMEDSFTAVCLRAEGLGEQLNSLGLRLLQIAETFERVDEESVRDVDAIPWTPEVGQILRAGVSDSLADIAELEPSVWKNLGSEERILVLQRVENTLAQTQGRPPVLISIEELPDPILRNLWGHYGQESRRAMIDRSDFEGDDIKGLVEAVAHEGRHAYQHYAVDNPGFHPDAEEVERWRHNFDDVLSAEEYGYQRYRTQPIEVDASEYAEAVAAERYRD